MYLFFCAFPFSTVLDFALLTFRAQAIDFNETDRRSVKIGFVFPFPPFRNLMNFIFALIEYADHLNDLFH